RALKGRIVYSFPIREAQRQGYFAPIDYISVADAMNPDAAIAAAAVDRLRRDLSAGYDHLIMARVERIGRAERILADYKNIAAEFCPVTIHSQATKMQRTDALIALRSRSSRIIVCVDMLGEGFDFPQLKIAAMHDAHKSL